MKVLIVEDYPKVNQLLASHIRKSGYEANQAFTAEEALQFLGESKYDIILTDLMLPGIQGEELISKIRAVSDIYIIVISAKIEESGKLSVLSMGADDYLTKPFSMDEVIIKLKNIEKRLKINDPIILSFNQGDLIIKPLEQQVFKQKALINLTHNEYVVLHFLATHKNNVYTRDQILDNCFKDSDAYDRIIDTYIKNIRKLLCPLYSDYKYIKTHYGAGYQFIGALDE